VVPLDFRTALIETSNKVVIQAKPLNLKTDDDLLKEPVIYGESDSRDPLKRDFDTIEGYLEAVKKEPFKEEAGDQFILIDPDINIKEKFDAIDLLCNKEQRLNNTLNAPIRTKEQIAADHLRE
jgi:hypothetical protein